MIPLVVASERGTAQTSGVARRGWGCRTATLYANREQNTLENVTIDGDSPVWSCFMRCAIAGMTNVADSKKKEKILFIALFSY